MPALEAIPQDVQSRTEIALSYNGYTATARYHNDDGIYHGKLDGKDLMTFGGESEEAVTADFMALVDSIEKSGDVT